MCVTAQERETEETARGQEVELSSCVLESRSAELANLPRCDSSERSRSRAAEQHCPAAAGEG